MIASTGKAIIDEIENVHENAQATAGEDEEDGKIGKGFTKSVKFFSLPLPGDLKHENTLYWVT